jgi:hypothetical protein
MLNGKKAYGVLIAPGTGYRNDKTNGIAVVSSALFSLIQRYSRLRTSFSEGDAAEGIYAVFDGTHFNGACCFDYGNAETNNTDTGSADNGHMEAIYFGSAGSHKGAGNGPWVMADLENGLFSGGNRTTNPSNPSMTSRFVTAVVKGKPGHWAIRGGNAASGQLGTFYSGVRPSGGYNPMNKEGAIILGIGGDNSHWGQGTFYEGVRLPVRRNRE